MRRSFAIFPSGLAGIALLMMRVLIGSTAIAESVHYVLMPSTQSWVLQSAALLLVLDGAMLLVGLLTPIVAAVLFIIIFLHVLKVLPLAFVILLNSPLAAVEAAIMCAAIIALGPGAYSVDGRLFGHRQLIIPRHGSSDEPD